MLFIRQQEWHPACKKSCIQNIFRVSPVLVYGSAKFLQGIYYCYCCYYYFRFFVKLFCSYSTSWVGFPWKPFVLLQEIIFTDWMCFLMLNQQHQSIEWRNGVCTLKVGRNWSCMLFNNSSEFIVLVTEVKRTCTERAIETGNIISPRTVCDLQP